MKSFLLIPETLRVKLDLDDDATYRQLFNRRSLRETKKAQKGDNSGRRKTVYNDGDFSTRILLEPEIFFTLSEKDFHR